MRRSWETMTSVSAGHNIILTPTQPVGSGRPQRESNPGPPHQESRALPTELPRPQKKKKKKKKKLVVVVEDEKNELTDREEQMPGRILEKWGTFYTLFSSRNAGFSYGSDRLYGALAV